ncbi:MAG: nucleotidyltransferase domain-containing protein [Chloroflexota bacterium]|nr:nucleotidyltransferase domain-containing protein [Chloroflexota bacterium]MDE2908888.1 nucleotidyltransferase domain-containing protein [Chloroflexota bacterium]
MSEPVAIDLPVQAIRAYCETQPIARLSLFGSAMRGELRDESDIDLLIEYRPGTTVTLLTLAGHEIDLGNLIGRKVDLRMKEELRKTFRQQVIDCARPIYEEKS